MKGAVRVGDNTLTEVQILQQEIRDCKDPKKKATLERKLESYKEVERKRKKNRERDGSPGHVAEEKARADKEKAATSKQEKKKRELMNKDPDVKRFTAPADTYQALVASC